MSAKPRFILLSIFIGIAITVLMTMIAFAGDSRACGCTFVWQVCLVQTVIHTPDNPIHEASPIDLFGFIIGVLLGVPIYASLSYLALTFWRREH